MLLLLVVATPAGAFDSTDFTGDVQAPEVVTFTLSPGNADVTNAGATFNLSMRLTDDLSGVRDYPGFNFYSPAEEEHSYGAGLTLASGDRRDGVWTGTFQVARYSAPGRYRIQFSVSDQVGNSRAFDAASLAARGFPTGFDISDANPDTTPAEVSEVRVSPAPVDVRAGPATLQVDVSATDGQSGVKYIVVFLHDREGPRRPT